MEIFDTSSSGSLSFISSTHTCPLSGICEVTRAINSRYVRHPPISDKRMSSYDGDDVTFLWDHPSTNVRHYVTLPAIEFIYRVVIHLPETGFKMIVPYGLYSPKYVNKPTVQAIFMISGKVVDPKKLTWRESIMIFTGRDPLACSCCGREMIEVCIV